MKPALPLIVACPKCRQKIPILQLASSNTFGAIAWSDGKFFARMSPSLSPIFKCDGCGHYFSVREQPVRRATDYELGLGQTGVRDYLEVKEALSQFRQEGRMIENNFILLLIHAYNDKYYRGYRLPDQLSQQEAPEQEKLYFRGIVDTLLRDSEGYDPLFVAEMLRETERYDECLDLIEKSHTTNDARVVALIREAAQARYHKVLDLNAYTPADELNNNNFLTMWMWPIRLL